jgi:hypothetical protein
MDRKVRALFFLAVAFINFFLFRDPGGYALGALFLLFGIYLFVSGPATSRG